MSDAKLYTQADLDRAHNQGDLEGYSRGVTDGTAEIDRRAVEVAMEQRELDATLVNGTGQWMGKGTIVHQIRNSPLAKGTQHLLEGRLSEAIVKAMEDVHTLLAVEFEKLGVTWSIGEDVRKPLDTLLRKREAQARLNEALLLDEWTSLCPQTVGAYVEVLKGRIAKLRAEAESGEQACEHRKCEINSNGKWCISCGAVIWGEKPAGEQAKGKAE